MTKPNHCRWISICPLRRFEKRGKINLEWKINFCESNWNQCMRYQNVVNGLHNSDQMLPDGSLINEK